MAQDKDGFLVERMEAALDGDYQRYTISPGGHIREHFFGTRPEILEMVEKHSDEQLERLARGGHDSEKVHAAYKAAVENTGSPTVILAKTIKGYGLGEAGEGKNITHQQKKLNEEELKQFSVPVPHTAYRRGGPQGSLLQARPRQPRDEISSRKERGSRRKYSEADRPGRTPRENPGKSI